MLIHPTLDQLNQLGLFGMAKAFGEVAASGDCVFEWVSAGAVAALSGAGRREF